MIVSMTGELVVVMMVLVVMMRTGGSVVGMIAVVGVMSTVLPFREKQLA